MPSIAIQLRAITRQPLFIWLIASMVIARELIPVTVDVGATTKDTLVSHFVQVLEDAERTVADSKWRSRTTNHTRSTRSFIAKYFKPLTKLYQQAMVNVNVTAL